MKKLCCLLIAFCMLFLCSCSAEARPDVTMFADRLALCDERYYFDYTDMFIYENITHVYLSLCSVDDVMLSFEMGTNGNIDSVTVTAFSDMMNTSEAREELKTLFCAVVDSFSLLSEYETEEKNKSLSYMNPDLYFSDIYETYTSLRNNFIFSSNSMYMCLYCDYYEVMSLDF